MTAGWTRVQAQAGLRQGWLRVRSAWWPVVEACAAAAIAYVLAHDLLGHTNPFFAPVAAWVALGHSRDREPRRVAEVAIGVAIGVGAADLVVHLIGSGWWQLALVLLVSALVARFVDRGAVMTAQAGVQAIVIVLLPTASGGPFGRWVDALIGGVTALAVTALAPADLRRRPRTLARASTQELAGTLHALGRALTSGSSSAADDVLLRGRASQPALDEWLESAQASCHTAQVAPAARRHLAELVAAVDQAVLADRAMRNARVLARRAGPALVEAGPLPTVGALVEQLARAVDDLADALGAGRDPERARTALAAVADGLDPHIQDGWHAQSLALLTRSLVVDLLKLAGADEESAHAHLPPL